MKIGSKIEYIPMGKFNIDDIEKNDYTTKITCFDNIIKFETPYFSELGDLVTLQQVVNELSKITGVQFTGSLPAYKVKKLEGFTCREILGYVASICGGNAIITREGKFTIVYSKDIDYSISGDNYVLNNFKREEVKYKIGKITCQIKDKEIISKGSLGIDSMEVQFENPWINESILTDIYNKLNGFEYLGYTMKWQGDMSLDIGDIITCIDTKGIVRKLPILSQKFNYTGGLTSEIGAKGESKNKNSFSSNGNTANKVNRVVTELLLVNKALINKANIQDLEAVSIKANLVATKTAEIEKAIIDVAHIRDLEVISASVQELKAANAIINNALISKADITELNAVRAQVNILEGSTANIKTLLAGNLTSSNIQTAGITGDNLNMNTVFVKDANIIDLSAAKINTGILNTNLVNVQGSNGNLLIKDNTIQIKDKSRVRVQIGKDAKDDYTMYVWDQDGKLMFDALGLKAEGIKEKIIRDDMVSDNANISGFKLNISSVVTAINDGTTTLKSSKILFDSIGQTLDIAFNNLKSEFSENKTLTESHTTKINVQQGQINSLIQDTTIVKDTSLKLQDNYNRTNIKVNELTSTIGSHASQINAATGLIEQVSTKVNLVERNLEGITQRVTSTEVKFNNLKVGGRNLIKNSGACTDLKYWGKLAGGGATSGDPYLDKSYNGFYKGVSLACKEFTNTSWCLLYNNSLENYKFKVGEDYVISGVIWSSVDGEVTVQISDPDSRNKVFSTDVKVSASVYTEFELKFKARIEGNLNHVRFCHNKAGLIFVDKIKLEEGTIKTAWCNAQEDVLEESSKIISDKIAEVKITTDSINQKVSKTESSVTELNTKINNTKIANRNIIKNSGYCIKTDYWMKFVGGGAEASDIYLDNGRSGIYKGVCLACKKFTNTSWCILANVSLETEKFKFDVGKEYIVSGLIWSNTNDSVSIQISDQDSKNSVFMTKIELKANAYTEFSFVFKATITGNQNHVRFYMFKAGQTIFIPYVKLSEGNVNSPWCPSFEETQDYPKQIDSKLEVTKNQLATIETNLNSITSRVRSVENTTTNINGKIINQETRLQQTEQKLTPQGLTTTISSAINLGGVNKIDTTSFVMDKQGLTIKNGAIRILNKGNKEVLKGNVNGDLDMVGKYTNYKSNGIKAVEINDSNMTFYDWDHNGRELGHIYSSYLQDHPNCRGFSLAHNDNAYMTLGYRKKDNSNACYIIFDKFKTNPGYASPIQFCENATFRKELAFDGTTYVKHGLQFGSAKTSTDPEIWKATNNNSLTFNCYGGVGGGFQFQSSTGTAWMGFYPGENYLNRIYFSTYVGGDFSVKGSKNSLQDTEHYGERLINALESAEYYYLDIGFGKVNATGECFISIDDILQECINLDCKYHVFTQVYNNGEIIKIDRQRGYFIVHGKPGTEFSWKYVAKRKGYENVRLDKPDVVGYSDNIAIFTEKDLKVNTSEEVLQEELNLRLEDILMEE